MLFEMKVVRVAQTLLFFNTSDIEYVFSSCSLSKTQ